MAVQQRKSIDEEFSQNNYGQSGWGIQNAQSNKMMAANDNRAPQSRQNTNIVELETKRPANNQSSKNTRRKRMVSVYQGANESNDDSDFESPRNKRVANKYISNPLPKLAMPANINAIPTPKLDTRFFSVAVTGMMLWLWPIQILIGCIGITMLGVAGLLEDTWLEWIGGAGAWFVGFEYDSLMPIAMLGLFIPIVFGVFSLMVAGSSALILGFRPLNGDGASYKTSMLLAAFVGYALPIVNLLFPWGILYVKAVKHYPK